MGWCLYALPMTHRLLHTLVFSSAALVGGCGAAHATPASDAAATPDAGSDAPDVRYCEPGWPTTKGQFRYDLEGVAYSCAHPSEPGAMPDLSMCCVIRPEDLDESQP